MEDVKEVILSVLRTAVKAMLAVLVVVIIYRGALIGYEVGYRVFSEQPVSTGEGTDITVTISEGMGSSEIADLLEEEGVIRSALIFKLQNRLSSYKKTMKAGTYTLNTSMTNDEIMEALSEGSDGE